jgi:hypothetical protein
VRRQYEPLPEYRLTERPSFRREIEHLNSKWPNAERDVQARVSQKRLSADAGTPIPNLGIYGGRVFKLRISSQDLKDGSSGGFRLIYLVSADRKQVELLSIYCKKEKTNIPTEDLLKLIDQAQRNSNECQVKIETEPDCAEVWIGEECVDYAPCTLKLTPGTYTVILKIPPDRSVAHSFSCDGQETVHLSINIP